MLLLSSKAFGKAKGGHRAKKILRHKYQFYHLQHSLWEREGLSRFSTTKYSTSGLKKSVRGDSSSPGKGPKEEKKATSRGSGLANVPREGAQSRGQSIEQDLTTLHLKGLFQHLFLGPKV